ncbi:MAG: hypothetical protein HQL45_08880 [Alphaproteobacteria bacterium]|nr:hypothetical protein [Alphaproteobacteria bacterium]
MSRVGSLASDNMLLSQLLNSQKRLQDLNTMLNTEKKSQNYAGISRDSFNLVSLENQHDQTVRLIGTNTTQKTKLKIMSDSLKTVMDIAGRYRTELGAFLSKGADDPDALGLVQQLSWTHLTEIQSLMNEKMNGNFIFSGGKTNTKPVDITWGSLTQYQSSYKQATVSSITGQLTFDNAASTITAANAGTFTGIAAGDSILISGTASNDATYTVASIDATKTILTLTTAPVNEVASSGATMQPPPAANTGNLTFSSAGSTITAANAGAFSGYSAGDRVTFSGTNSNNTAYTIASIDGTNTILTLTAAPVTEVATPGVMIRPQSQFPTTRSGHVALGTNYYYKGDNMQIDHRIDENRTVTTGITANDPAIEKLMRAMLIMSQGNMSQVETSNPTLIGDVIQLVNDSIQHDPSSSELDSDLLTMQYTIETHVTSIQRAIDLQSNFKATSESRLSDLENIEKTEIVTLLTSQQNALEVSYTAFGRIQQLSLADYI